VIEATTADKTGDAERRRTAKLALKLAGLDGDLGDQAR